MISISAKFRIKPSCGGHELAESLLLRKAILGVFDEGCMGMYNAIIDDELLNKTGVFKERLSQSALLARMRTVKDEESVRARQWLDDKGMRFLTGKDEQSELTDAQIHQQLKMYIAAVRIAHEFGCDAIGIQYQQGLKDMAPASDLAEGLLNNTDRPPVFEECSGKELYAGRPLPHFNEVDECAGLDALITNRCWSALGLDPATTLHDVRWGEHFSSAELDAFVWVLQISGAAPASHFEGGYQGASSERQPPMYFPLGGGTLKGIGRPGEIVWSRVFVEDGALHLDIGPRLSRSAAGTGRGSPLVADDQPMAAGQYGLSWHHAGCLHGSSSRKSREYRLCSRCRDRQRSARNQSSDVPCLGSVCASVRFCEFWFRALIRWQSTGKEYILIQHNQ